MAGEIINTENITSQTQGLVYIKEKSNLIIQNEITCGQGDSLSIKYYGTIFETAVVENDIYWIDITDFLFKTNELTCANETIRSMGIIDTNCTFTKIKVIITVVSAEPNNKIEIFYGT